MTTLYQQSAYKVLSAFDSGARSIVEVLNALGENAIIDLWLGRDKSMPRYVDTLLVAGILQETKRGYELTERGQLELRILKSKIYQ